MASVFSKNAQQYVVYALATMGNQPFQCGNVLRRQILTHKDGQSTERIKILYDRRPQHVQKNTQIIIMIMYHVCMFLTESQINIDLLHMYSNKVERAI